MYLTYSNSPPTINNIGFINVRCDDEAYYDCVLYWKRLEGYEIEDIKFNTFKEMEAFAHDFLATKHNPFNAAILRVNKTIAYNVNSAAHKMNLKIAQFRGNLFTQIIDLKHGPTYRDNILDSIIAELQTDKIIGYQDK